MRLKPKLLYLYLNSMHNYFLFYINSRRKYCVVNRDSWIKTKLLPIRLFYAENWRNFIFLLVEYSLKFLNQLGSVWNYFLFYILYWRWTLIINVLSTCWLSIEIYVATLVNVDYHEASRARVFVSARCHLFPA